MFNLFRKTLSDSEVKAIVDRAVPEAAREFAQHLTSGSGEFFEDTMGAALRAAHTEVIFKQAKNAANRRADSRDDLYRAALGAARKLIEYRVANANFATTLQDIIDDARSKYGQEVASGARKAAFEAFQSAPSGLDAFAVAIDTAKVFIANALAIQTNSAIDPSITEQGYEGAQTSLNADQAALWTATLKLLEQETGMTCEGIKLFFVISRREFTYTGYQICINPYIFFKRPLGEKAAALLAAISLMKQLNPDAGEFFEEHNLLPN